MRLIDADAKILAQFYDEEHEEWEERELTVAEYLSYSDTAIPFVDPVLVIRCKDCKHFDGYYCHNKWWGDGHGNYTPPIKIDDGFCDWAERREE